MNISESFPSDSEVDEYIIYCYKELGDTDSATAYYDEVLENGDESYEIDTAMGNYMYYETMYMESVLYYDKAISLNPERLEGYTNKM